MSFSRLKLRCQYGCVSSGGLERMFPVPSPTSGAACIS